MRARLTRDVQRPEVHPDSGGTGGMVTYPAGTTGDARPTLGHDMPASRDYKCSRFTVDRDQCQPLGRNVFVVADSAFEEVHP